MSHLPSDFHLLYFVSCFDTLCESAYDNIIDKQFVKRGQKRNDGELIALIHSEASEALEALRHGNPPDDKIPNYSGAEAELADIVIRCMNMAAERGWHLGDAIVAKMRYNETRPVKHGGKAF